MSLQDAVYGLVWVVFVGQLWGAGRAFRPIQGSRMGILSLLAPLAFVVILIRLRSIALNVWMVVPGCLGEAAAAALFEWARRTIRGRFFSYIFSDDSPRFLCSGGPFAYIRNPFYGSYLLAYSAAVAMFPDWISAGIVAAMVLYYWGAAVFEERKFLSGPLAAEYREFMRRTGRFLPRLRTAT